MNISVSSVCRFVRHDLGLASLKRIKGQNLSEEDEEKRVDRRKRLLRNLTRDRLD